MVRVNSPLLSASELSEQPEKWVVIDVRPGAAGRAAYEASHIKGAIYLDLDKDLAASVDNPLKGGRHPLPTPEAWTATLSRLGICEADQVVLYDDQAGAFAAARAWWMFSASGQRDVRVLEGGLAAATQRNMPMSAGVTKRPATQNMRKPKQWTRNVIAIADVLELREYKEFRLVDVRSQERYLGVAEPIDPIAGHIPGARNVPYTASLDERGHFLPKDTMAEMYKKRLESDQPAKWIVYCGSGVTACHTLLALEHAGLYGASLYVGSWSEWSRSGLPIATNI